MQRVFETGKFSNLLDVGFQEGYYPTVDQIEDLFSANGFQKKLMRSLRGFGYEKEDALYRLETENPEMFKTAMKLLNDTSEQKEIIEMCGHAIYVGCKQS